MARDQALVTCPAGVWTELTNSDATTVTFQVVGGAIKVRATTGSAPSNLSDNGWRYYANSGDPQTSDGELRVPLASFSSTASVDRLFATPINGRKASVIVDHA